ncbi:MAG: DUF1080 domain-containing protein [Planctomycetes bacterium]|nr:DUF1080 domain-containing protein [Planctomycetota bacterium]
MATKMSSMASFAFAQFLIASFIACACTNSTATEHATGLSDKNAILDTFHWTPIFNGKNLDGWTQFPPAAAITPPATPAPASAPPPTWSVLDGVLRTTGTPVGYIATTALYTDFELELEWRFDPAKGAGNSGVLLRVQNPDKVWPACLEAQLQSGSAGDIWNIGNFAATVDPSRTDGRHTTRIGESNELALGQWNKYRIVMDGGWLSLWVNGKLQNVATGVQRVAGRIALQSEGAWIEFRDIRVRPLISK